MTGNPIPIPELLTPQIDPINIPPRIEQTHCIIRTFPFKPRQSHQHNQACSLPCKKCIFIETFNSLELQPTEITSTLTARASLEKTYTQDTYNDDYDTPYEIRQKFVENSTQLLTTIHKIMHIAHETTIKATTQASGPSATKNKAKKPPIIDSIVKLRRITSTWRKTEKMLVDPNLQNDINKQANIRSNLLKINYISKKFLILPHCPWRFESLLTRPDITTETLPTWRQWAKYLSSTTHKISSSQDLQPTQQKRRLKSYDSSPRRKPLPFLKAQQKLSNKSIDGPIDGIYSDIKHRWIVDTEELQETITEKTTRMYKRHWFARITNKILWETTTQNNISRTTMRTKDNFDQLIYTNIQNLKSLSKTLNSTKERDLITQTDIIDIRRLANETSLDLPNELTNVDTTTVKLTTETTKWIQERSVEINLIIQLMDTYLLPAWDILQPKKPTQVMNERINWVLQKLTTKDEVREMFMSMKRNKTSGPSGFCAEHYANAPP
jgi:hypothetical protein